MTQHVLSSHREIQALKPSGHKTVERFRVSSRHGAGLYIELRGDRVSKRWVYRFRLGNKRPDYVIGTFPSVSLKQAREMHGQAVQLVKQGIDPRYYRAAEVARNTQAWTMQEAYSHWIQHYASSQGRSGYPPTEKTVNQMQRRWRLHLQDELASFRVMDLTRPKLIEVLSTAASKAREEARQCLSLLKALLEYCEDMEQIEESPAATITPKKIKARPSPPKKRFLTLPELRQLLIVLDQGAGRASPSTCNAIKLIIATGARRSEVSQLCWSELDLENGVWTLPGHRVKTRQERRIKLSQYALDVLRLQRQFSHSEYVFESPRKCGAPIGIDVLTRAVKRFQGRDAKEQNLKAPLAHLESFGVHDLRRTVTTAWTDHLDVDKLLADVMIGHSEPRLIATYNRADRWPMQVRVWDRWGETLTRLTSDQHGQGEIAHNTNVIHVQFGNR
ncbi:tyrosine-type recombinase/integrase [Marinobacterium sediminicola]|uniref:Site-specific recombinase XerD n=1 Tax=Marinobacterium sediminicola TaxID=518898 RepID=A0ABY1S2P4_9GAMM|nr:site-specific integrase [Marinobacterium sediminicola]ULG68838.1 tyrosine-type recombinase/integrase [Marinobacterium sediminicola]SMR77552.1 Site-specific recombinase XerD [Marinobacterium sediminicola]